MVAWKRCSRGHKYCGLGPWLLEEQPVETTKALIEFL
jgi:hypothetical protein